MRNSGRAEWENIVVQLKKRELAELEQCVCTLEEVLVSLDTIGAGIAAIHVDAAINQLKTNLENLHVARVRQNQASNACLSEHPIECL